MADITYRKQKGTNGRSDRAFVLLDGRRHYLGVYGSAESWQRYAACLAEHKAGGGMTPTDAPVSVSGLTERYGKDSDATAWTTQLYGSLPAAEFSPKKLKAVRQAMADSERVPGDPAKGKRYSRGTVNRYTQRVRRMFKWAAGEELVPGETWRNLQAVEGLRRGETNARETQKVEPVPAEQIDALESHLSRQIWGMIQLQLVTGMRPGEVCGIKGEEVKRENKGWAYCPAEHKTSHHDIERTIPIGPKGRAILREFWRDEGYLFSPAEAERERREREHAARQTPNGYGNTQGSNRKGNPDWQPGDHYTKDTYRRAIHRACDKAKVERWSPNRLRHNFATRVRAEHGVDVAQTILGHTTIDTTAIYAERDQKKARAVVEKVG